MFFCLYCLTKNGKSVDDIKLPNTSSYIIFGISLDREYESLSLKKPNVVAKINILTKPKILDVNVPAKTYNEVRAVLVKAIYTKVSLCKFSIFAEIFFLFFL